MGTPSGQAQGSAIRSRDRIGGAWTAAIVPLLLFGCGEGREPPVAQAEKALHADGSLSGSHFEIDDDANLELGHDPPSLDWAEIAEHRQPDLASGTGDDSFGQGTKEDSPVPTVVDGSIPPNKSDLLTFGAYLEENGGGKFLHLFWHRVQEPSGTTNMDFEFNQSSTLSSNGVTPVRTSGDLLIQYDLAQGGTHPVLFLSRWIDGTEGKTAADCQASNSLPCWSKKANLTAAGDATGSINSTAIAEADADDLGGISARTFGEASLDFAAITGDDECVAFGSAYLKSRSSDSFTAALKDFIRPKAVNISNCGSVKVIKTDDIGGLLAGASFKLVRDFSPFGTAPGAEDTGANEVVVGTCVTDAAGACEFAGVLQGQYWLIETQAPPNHDLATPVYQHVVVVADETVEKTFVDPRQRGAILVTKTRKHADSGAGDHPHPGVTFTVGGVAKVTDAAGKACFDGLLFGSYVVTETVPVGYQGEAPKNVVVDNKASCADAVFVGETVGFQNTPLSDITVSFSSQVAGGTKATIACTGLIATPADATPSAFDDTAETFVGLLPGTYTCTVVIDP